MTETQVDAQTVDTVKKVSVDPFFSKENKQAIKESVEQLKEGKVIKKTIEELEAMERE